MSRRLKIAIFTPSFLPKCSGAEIFHHNLAIRLAAAGHQVSLVIPRRNVRQLKESEVNLPYDLVAFPANLWSVFKRSSKLALAASNLVLGHLQRKHKFDLWHGVVAYPTGISLIAWQESARRKTPYLVRPVGDDVVSAPEGKVGARLDLLINDVVTRHLPKARAIVAVSEQIAGECRDLDVPAERIHVIPNAVDGSRFLETNRRAETRDRYGIAQDAFVFLSVGRNHPQKDYSTLLKAAAKLPRNALFLICGRGTSSLKDEARHLGIGDLLRTTQVKLTSIITAMPAPAMVALYQCADAFVMSSVVEGFSSALLEAMAAGLPAIVTDTPGCAELVRNGKDALMVPRRNPERLAAAMLQLMTEDETRKTYAERALNRAAMFDWPEVVQRYLSLYEKLSEPA